MRRKIGPSESPEDRHCKFCTLPLVISQMWRLSVKYGGPLCFPYTDRLQYHATCSANETYTFHRIIDILAECGTKYVVNRSVSIVRRSPQCKQMSLRPLRNEEPITRQA
jgi:hypothetical protein